MEHLLSFVTDDSGGMVSIHADLAGVNLLIEELQAIREGIENQDCPHIHLFTVPCGEELTDAKLESQEQEVNIVQHVKIHGWTAEWAERHRLRRHGSE